MTKTATMIETTTDRAYGSKALSERQLRSLGDIFDVPTRENYKFVLVTRRVNAVNADAEARNNGGALATVLDSAENAIFTNKGRELKLTQVWIGLHYVPTANIWRWSGIHASAFSAWFSGEPNNGGSEHFAALDCRHGRWNNLAATGFCTP